MDERKRNTHRMCTVFIHLHNFCTNAHAPNAHTYFRISYTIIHTCVEKYTYMRMLTISWCDKNQRRSAINNMISLQVIGDVIWPLTGLTENSTLTFDLRTVSKETGLHSNIIFTNYEESFENVDSMPRRPFLLDIWPNFISSFQTVDYNCKCR